MDEDAFLPSENDRLKAHIKEMRTRLAVATVRDKQLRKELIEEDLSYMTVSTLVDLIQDPTRVANFEFDAMGREVFDKMMSTLENCCIREAISYHRLAGRTLFKFKGDRSCVRLETFYRKTYKECYYIFYEKDQAYHSDLIKGMRRSLVEHHTVPNFIHLSSIEKRHLPADFDTFIRIVHDQLQAYVTKREILKEVAQLKKTHAITIKYQSESIHKVEIEVVNVHGQTMLVDMAFEDKSSAYPTTVIIRDDKDPTADAAQQLPDMATQFRQRPMIDVLIDLLETELQQDTFMEYDRMELV
ncbi:hypothetical protein HMPREF1544_12068 [Mucor circinelloides 1006PhL]|uniref:Uncharacterized protein n=1 Tax=Mucor circinelloides f. circinelloides (strain 1006PhL) TaxID=1220926 RepID=S2IZB7_MUCC1|nr:hypothetical protein HMPREF1544_12068 [Mucor circinelloides 1006PhL]